MGITTDVLTHGRTVIDVNIVGIDTDTVSLVFGVIRSPVPAMRANARFRLNLSPQSLPAWSQQDSLNARARLMRDELCRHPGFSAILDDLIHSASEGAKPFDLRLAEGDFRLIARGAVCEEIDPLFAIAERWAMGRVAEPSSVETGTPVLRTQIRLLAVISAYGVSGQKTECQALCDVARAARTAFDVRLRLLVGDEQTHASVTAAVDGRFDWVELAHVEKTGTRVIQDIVGWRPNVVHFFSRVRAGSTPDDQVLELATGSDYTASDGGSVNITAAQLGDMGSALDSPLLLVLNCRSSGNAFKEHWPIVLPAISSGFLGAVTMVVDPVAGRDNHDMTRALYQRVFGDLHRSLTIPARRPRLAGPANAPEGHAKPIYFRLSPGEPEKIPWEALCDNHGHFLALDRIYPIGRIVEPIVCESRLPPVLSTPMKLLAVVSAYGVAGQKKEWEMLRDAARTARDAGFDVRLRVLVGDDQTHAAVKAEINAALGWAELSHIEETGARVTQDIIAWQPNVVHFFCHGYAGSLPSDQAIELATGGDPAVRSGGSVSIGYEQLVRMSRGLENPWLLTLNCCSSGEATQWMESLVSHAVAAGFPAAVAMIAPVAAVDAHEFTRAFYRGLFDQLRTAAAALVHQPRVPFEWLQSLHFARTAICDLHGGNAANAPQWSIPVLYVRGIDPPQFMEPPPAGQEDKQAEFILRTRLTADFLEASRGTMSEDRRLAVMSEILTDVPKSYWPNVDGRFDHA